METKPRLLYLLKILNYEYGISTYRTILSKDVIALQPFGIDVVSVRSTQTKYFIGRRDFELAELKILMDAVESSKFIKMKTGLSKIRNKGIAASFSYMNVVEAWGSEIPKIFGEAEEYGLREPELIDMGSDF